MKISNLLIAITLFSWIALLNLLAIIGEIPGLIFTLVISILLIGILAMAVKEYEDNY